MGTPSSPNWGILSTRSRGNEATPHTVTFSPSGGPRPAIHGCEKSEILHAYRKLAGARTSQILAERGAPMATNVPQKNPSRLTEEGRALQCPVARHSRFGWLPRFLMGDYDSDEDA